MSDGPGNHLLRHHVLTAIPVERFLSANQASDEEIRRVHRAGRHLARCSRRRVRLLSRPLGLRQDHVAAGDCGTRHPDNGNHRAGGRRHFRASALGARLRNCVPVLRPVPEHDGDTQRRLRARESDALARRGPGPGEGPARSRRPPRPGRQVPGAALGRATAAHRARPRHRDVARPAAARRAALGPRRQGAGAPALRGQQRRGLLPHRSEPQCRGGAQAVRRGRALYGHRLRPLQ